MSRFKNLKFDEFKIKKMKKLVEMGVNCYPYKFERKNSLNEIKDKYKDVTHDKSEEEVITAGFIYVIRQMGRVIFVDLKDESGSIQLYLREDSLGKSNFKTFRDYIETGDVIGIKGNVFRTKKDEITIWVNHYEILSKSLCPLPEKYHGLRDVAKRYRYRYVDLKTNEDISALFKTRSKVVSSIRRFLDDRGFLEFETPILQPLYGGANARPFTTHHNFLKQDFYLRIAPELYLKRLIVGGFERVYEIARNFRNEDIDTTHNPEFSMLELYEAYKDYNDIMKLCEDLISEVAFDVHGKYEIEFNESTINLKTPWKKITMEDSVEEYGDIKVYEHSLEELRQIAKEKGFEDYEKASTHGEFLVVFFENLVEKNITQPTFIYDFPIEVSPLAKKHRKKEGFTERFELFVGGYEIANGFSELNDPLDQKERFEAQDKKRRSGDAEAHVIDYDYINALGYGMPPTGGIGIGIDRLVMLLTNKTSIKEVILFPQMKVQNITDDPNQE